ncbi:tetratricopeptide repeat protein [Mailhella sp.]|uniref:tetratricopeptide repeat protein n=1 Tax=Mailhella sp. TaxID=1981029 RepID=UPI003AB61B8F
MKKNALCLLLSLLLAGCGHIPFHLPFMGDDEKTPEPAEVQQPERKPTYGVSPQAQAYLSEAMEYWTDSGECTDPEKAAALLDKAVAADPLDPAPYLMRSLALSDLGYLNEAFDDATKAIRLSPTAAAYATRGLICLKQRHPEGARRDFAYAEKINPKEPLIYVYRSAGAFLDGRNGDACDDLKRACELGHCRPWNTATENKLCR